MGLVIPVIVSLRILFQELCIKKYGWDTLLAEEDQAFFRRWITSLEEVNIYVNRCYLSAIEGNVKSVSLHAFGDASKKAYCGTVYLCSESNNGERKAVLVASKARVAPMAELSIP